MNLNDLTESERINDRMERLYGKHTVKNLSNYRIIFADERYTEKRQGTFNVYAGDIFLREETGIREVEKYPWLRGQWVVEGLVPNPHSEVYDGDSIYNPIWAFPENLPLSFEAIVKVMNAVFTHVKATKPRSEEELFHEEKAILAKRKLEMLDKLDNLPSTEGKPTFEKMVILGR